MIFLQNTYSNILQPGGFMAPPPPLLPFPPRPTFDGLSDDELRQLEGKTLENIVIGQKYLLFSSFSLNSKLKHMICLGKNFEDKILVENTAIKPHYLIPCYFYHFMRKIFIASFLFSTKVSLGDTRTALEGRIRLLQNVSTLLDAAVMHMQIYVNAMK